MSDDYTYGSINGIRLVETCSACPEQYDAFLGSSQRLVGYLRLRHGYFSVTCPNAEGELVYEAEPQGDGMFDDDERNYYLQTATAAIRAWVRSHGDD